MSDEQPAAGRAAPPSSYRLIITLAVIAMMSGLLVATTFQVTSGRIQDNRRAALEEAIFEVLPEATSKRAFTLGDNGLRPLPEAEAGRAGLFAGYDADGELAGVAIEGAARGYQDVVRILYGYSPEDECITGFTVLQSSETPGLGDRVETDPEFLANFDCLDASLNPDRSALANEIVTVKHGEKTRPWQIDAISGATVTSQAIGAAMQSSASRILPALARDRQSLRQPPPPEDAP